MTGQTRPGGTPSGYFDGLQAGVLLAGDCALTVNSTSQVTVAGGTVFVNAQGLLIRATPSITVLSSIAAAVNNRLDQVVVDPYGAISVLTGTSDLVGNTLDNRNGAAVIPTGSQLLHDLLVTSGGVLGANRRDRRPWARGAYRRIARFANAVGGSDYTTTSTSAAEIDSTNLKPRIECSGVPLRVTLQARAVHSVANGRIGLTVFIDSTTPTVASTGELINQDLAYGAQVQVNSEQFGAGSFSPTFTPVAGSHQIAPAFRVVDAGTGKLWAQAGLPVIFTVEEIVRQNADNS